MQVQEWLRKAIYNRSPFKSRGANQLFVFMVSAFWHGYYPGYYLSFFFWFLQMYVQGLIFKVTRNQHSGMRQAFKKTGKLGRFIVTMVANIVFSSSAVFFIVLDGSIGISIFLKTLAGPQILLTLGLVIFSLPIGKRKHSKADIKELQK